MSCSKKDKTCQLCQHNHISLSTAACCNAYFVSDAKLPIVQNVRDLGVLVDNRLTFRDHINSIVSRGHVRAMQIWRRFLCKDVENLIMAFITYVRPMLEYCSPVWSPVSVVLSINLNLFNGDSQNVYQDSVHLLTTSVVPDWE